MSIIKKIKEKGFFKILKMLNRLPFFFFYKFYFKSCNRIFFTGDFQIRGKKHIEIDSFSAGSRIRVDAIDKYNDQVFEPSIIIGNNFAANNDLHIACTGTITIGDNVLVGSNVYITDHDHGIYASENNLNESSPLEKPFSRLLTANGYVTIGNNVFIGEYVTILKNVKIGDGAIIGAHSLILKDILPNTIVAGNPAKVIKKYNFNSKCWEKC